MNEEQKRILEDIHKKTENLMVEKANLTLLYNTRTNKKDR